MQLEIFLILCSLVGSSISGFIQLSPSTNSAEPQDGGIQIQKQLTKEDFQILFQLISLVKKMGGVSALETLLINSARNNYRSPISPNRRTFISEMYGPTVTELTVTSSPLALRKAPAPLVLTNFTINIQKLNIDPDSFKEED